MPQLSWQNDVEQLLRSRWARGEPFSLTAVYEFIPELQALHPSSQNVQARVRDALQGLRHRRVVEFLDKGRYRLR